MTPHPLASGKTILLSVCKTFLDKTIHALYNCEDASNLTTHCDCSDDEAGSDDLISLNSVGDDLELVNPKGSYLSESTFPQPTLSTSMLQSPNLITPSNAFNPASFTSTLTGDASLQSSVPNQMNPSGFSFNNGAGMFNYFVTLPSVIPVACSSKLSGSDSFPLLPSQMQNHGMGTPNMQFPIPLANTQKPIDISTSKKRPAPTTDSFSFLMQPQQQQQPEVEEIETTPTGRPKKKKSGEQKERRRERNRVLAKKTREKKRDHFETLQMEVLALQRENYKLRNLVKSEVVDSEGILQSCNALERVPQAVLDACNEMEKADPEHMFDMATRLKKSQHAFIITDPSLPNNPIVFASGDFLKLTGYDRSHVLGRNCRFLQGPATSKAKIEEIRNALETGEDVTITLLNYRADGKPFWNQLFIAALRNSKNEIVNYMGVIAEVAGPAPGDPEHGKTLPVVEHVGNPSPDADTAAIG